MATLRESLLEAHRAGRLALEVAAALTSRDDISSVATELVQLHNEHLLDALAVFESLDLATGAGRRSARRVFEESLPELDGPVEAMMRCIQRIYSHPNLASIIGTALNAFADFCNKDPSRPMAVLAVIKDDPDSFACFLPCAISAGMRIDRRKFLEQAIQLTKNENLALRRKALFYLGFIQWETRDELWEAAVAALEGSIASEADDESQAGALRSTLELIKHDPSQYSRAEAMLDSSLSHGGILTLQAGAYALAFQTESSPPSTLAVLLKHLKRVDPHETQALSLIDLGLHRLISKGQAEIAVEFLESLLLARGTALNLESLTSVVRSIQERTELRNTLITRWLLKGSFALCQGAEVICQSHDLEHPLSIDLDATLLRQCTPSQFVFIAEKAIGHFFTAPITAGSIVISLIRHTTNDRTKEELGQWLFNPLLLNYTGKLREYIIAQAATEFGHNKEVIEAALSRINTYLDVLHAVPPLPALHPSELQQEAYRRQQSRSMEASMKEAQKKSIFSGLFETSTLLYGRTSIFYTYDGAGKAHRTELPLSSHGVSVEMPRMLYLDPTGTDFTTLTLRSKSKPT